MAADPQILTNSGLFEFVRWVISGWFPQKFLLLCSWVVHNALYLLPLFMPHAAPRFRELHQAVSPGVGNPGPGEPQGVLAFVVTQ